MWLTTGEASTLGAEEVAARLRADLRIGLRWTEAKLRRQLAGFNELTVREEEPTWKKYIEQVSIKYVVLYLIMGQFISFFANSCGNKFGRLSHFSSHIYKKCFLEHI